VAVPVFDVGTGEKEAKRPWWSVAREEKTAQGRLQSQQQLEFAIIVLR